MSLRKSQGAGVVTDVVLHLALVASAIWSIVCRLNMLEPGKTSTLVAVQLIGLGAALMASLMVPAQHAAPVVLVGVCWFLGLGSSRWRDGPPAGVLKVPASQGET